MGEMKWGLGLWMRKRVLTERGVEDETEGEPNEKETLFDLTERSNLHFCCSSSRSSLSFPSSATSQAQPITYFAACIAAVSRYT